MRMLGASSDEYAAYQLGQQSAELDVATSRAIRSVLGRRAPQVDGVALLAQNRAMAEEVARLRTALSMSNRNLSALENDYAELRAWADMASRKLKQNGL